MTTLLRDLVSFIQRLYRKTLDSNPVDPGCQTRAKASVNDGYSEIATFSYLALENMLNLAGMPSRVSVYEDTAEILSLEIETTPNTGRIIGKNGHTLEAFQILLKAFIQRKFGQRISVVIDTNHYRKRYEEKLQNDAQKLAKKVASDQKTYRLRPMQAQDRRAIHRVFETHPDVMSHSIGQGDYRYVALSPRTK